MGEESEGGRDSDRGLQSGKERKSAKDNGSHTVIESDKGKRATRVYRLTIRNGERKWGRDF